MHHKVNISCTIKSAKYPRKFNVDIKNLHVVFEHRVIGTQGTQSNCYPPKMIPPLINDPPPPYHLTLYLKMNPAEKSFQEKNQILKTVISMCFTFLTSNLAALLPILDNFQGKNLWPHQRSP